MSRVGTLSPSPKDEYRDRADLGRLTKTASPVMVTTLLSNCLISAHILHACCRQGYVLTNFFFFFNTDLWELNYSKCKTLVPKG